MSNGEYNFSGIPKATTWNFEGIPKRKADPLDDSTAGFSFPFQVSIPSSTRVPLARKGAEIQPAPAEKIAYLYPEETVTAETPKDALAGLRPEEREAVISEAAKRGEVARPISAGYEIASPGADVSEILINPFLSPAGFLVASSIEGVKKGIETLKEVGRLRGREKQMEALLGTVAGLAEVGFSAATPVVPALAAITTSLNYLGSIPQIAPVVETVAAPVHAAVQPETKIEEYLSSIGDLVYFALTAKGLHNLATKARNGKLTVEEVRTLAKKDPELLITLEQVLPKRSESLTEDALLRKQATIAQYLKRTERKPYEPPPTLIGEQPVAAKLVDEAGRPLPTAAELRAKAPLREADARAFGVEPLPEGLRTPIREVEEKAGERATAPTEATARTQLESQGLEYRGVQTGRGGGELFLADDPKTGTTLAFRGTELTPEGISKHVENSRSTFRPKAAPEGAGKPTVSWDEAVKESTKRLKETGPIAGGLSQADISKHPKGSMATHEKLAYVLEPIFEKAKAEAVRLVEAGRMETEQVSGFIRSIVHDILQRHPEFRALSETERRQVFEEVQRRSRDLAYSQEAKGIRSSTEIVEAVERRDPLAPTKEQNDGYLSAILREVEAEVTKRAPRKQGPSVVSLLRSRIPIFHLEGIGRGLKGQELVQYVRGKLIESLRRPEAEVGPLFVGMEKPAPGRLEELSLSQRARGLRRLETESVERWIKWYEKEQRQIEAKETADRRLEEIANRVQDAFLGSVLSEADVKRVLKAAERFRVNSDNQGRFIAGFKSRISVMADSYGAAGPELAIRLYEGDIARGEHMEFGQNYMRRIRDVYDRVENPFEQQRINESVWSALENRANAKKHLDTLDKQAIYADAVVLLDSFKSELKAKGYDVLEDYFPHQKKVDVVDQVLTAIVDPRSVDVRDLNTFITEKSRHLKPRENANIDVKKDIRSVLSSYLLSVSRELAYKDAVNYYYTNFKLDIPTALKNRSMKRAIQAMENSLTPERGSGRLFQIANWIRSNQYPNFLAFAWKSSLQNATQHNYARLRWSKEADALERKLWYRRDELTGAVADAIDIASKEVPRYLETLRESEGVAQARLAEELRRWDPFQIAERRNWRRAELGSILDSAMREPGYKDGLERAKGDQVAAINEVLKDKDAFDRAVRRAEITSAETQVSPSPAMRGEFFDTNLHRIIGMFTAFKTRQLQILGQALGKQEGISGVRAKMILRQGVSGDIAPVEVLREVEGNRKALERLLRKSEKFQEDIGISGKDLRRFIDYVRLREGELNAEIKKLEPLRGGRAGQFAILGATYGKVFGLSMAFSLLWDGVDEALGQPDEDKNIMARAFMRAVWDTSPMPIYGINPSRFMVSPTVPNLENAMRYGTFSARGLSRDLVSYGLSAIPYAGIVDRVSGKRVSRAIVDVLAPRKKKGRTIYVP